MIKFSWRCQFFHNMSRARRMEAMLKYEEEYREYCREFHISSNVISRKNPPEHWWDEKNRRSSCCWKDQYKVKRQCYIHTYAKDSKSIRKYSEFREGEEKMQIKDIRVTCEGLYDILGWKLEKLYAYISPEENDFYLNGVVTVSDEKKGKNFEQFKLEICLCNSEGGIIDRETMYESFDRNLTELGFQAFTVHAYHVTRFCEKADDIAYVEIYPVIRA